jgi:hypothetical protein
MSDPLAYYPAYITSKAHLLGPGLARKKRTTESYLLAAVSTGAVITQTLTRDFGADAVTDTVTLTAVGTEARTRKRFEGTDVADWVALQITLGDDGTTASTPAWRLDRWDGLAEVQDGNK